MKLSSKDKELLINIWLLIVLPLVVYWITLRNNSVAREQMKRMQCSDCPVLTQEEIWDLNFLHYTD